MPRKGWTWVYSPKRLPKPKVPDDLKQVFDSAFLHLLALQQLANSQNRRGTTNRLPGVRRSATGPAQFISCTVGGTATPTLWNTRPAVFSNSLRSR
jgi:hypothetical protein